MLVGNIRPPCHTATHPLRCLAFRNPSTHLSAPPRHYILNHEPVSLSSPPLPQVQEADEPWDPDIVLTEVASAIYTEREKAEGGDAPTEPDEPLNEMK